MNKREPNWWEWEPGIEDGGVGRVLHVDTLLSLGEVDGPDIGNGDDAASRAHSARRTAARRKVEFDESDANRPVGVGCECREIPADCQVGEPCPDGRGGEVIHARWVGAREWLDDGETYDFCRLSVGCRDSSGKCDFWTRGKSDSSRGGCVHKYGSDVNSKSGYPQCYYDDEYRDGTGCCMCRFLCSNDDYTDYACVDEGGDSDGGEILTFYFDYDVAVLCEPWWKGWPDDEDGEDDGPPPIDDGTPLPPIDKPPQSPDPENPKSGGGGGMPPDAAGNVHGQSCGVAELAEWEQLAAQFDDAGAHWRCCLTAVKDENKITCFQYYDAKLDALAGPLHALVAKCCPNPDWTGLSYCHNPCNFTKKMTDPRTQNVIMRNTKRCPPKSPCGYAPTPGGVKRDSWDA